MRFGICTSPENATLVKECGYDFLEYQLFVVHDASEEEFNQMVKHCNEADIRVEALNCMLPQRFRLTGPDVDLEPIRQYLQKGVARAAVLGCKTIVFVSAWSRNMPEGFSDKKKAFSQLVDFLHIASDVCGKYGINIAIEPLSAMNIVSYISEGHYLIHLTKRDNVRLLADLYAVTLNYESWEDIVTYGEHIEHLHFCSNDRKFPRMNDPYDYAPFFEAVKRSGFDKRISIEGAVSEDMRKDYSDTMAVFKHYLK